MRTLGSWTAFKEAIAERDRLAAENARLRKALAECVVMMDFASVFVNTGERIKQPEGRDEYAATIASGRAALEGK